MPTPPRRPRRRPARAIAAIALAAALLAGRAGAARAQAVTAGAAEPAARPLIAKVELRGVRSVPLAQARLAVRTKASYCRLPLITPLCAVIRHQLFVRLHYLMPGDLERDVVSLRAFYWQRGFREARVDTVVTRRRHGLGIAFVVTEGPPTVVDTLVVERAGALLSAAAVRRAVRLRAGAPLDLAVLDTGLIALRDALWDAGYADALLEPDIAVDEAARRATVRVRVDPRWRARVGEVTVTGNEHLSDDAVRGALALRPGALYRRTDVMASQRFVYQSPAVAGVVIVAPPQGDSVKHLEVQVEERGPRQLGLVAGLTTVDFLQVGARGGVLALGGGRWSLAARGAAGNLLARQLRGAGPFADVLPDEPDDAAARPFLRPTWQGSVELTRLWLGSPRNRLTLAAFGHRRSEPGVFVDRGAGALVQLTREVADRAPVTLGWRGERAAVEAGDVYFCQGFGLCDAGAVAALRDPHRLASATLNAWLDRTNGAVAPSAGYTVRLDADHASRAVGSEFRHDRVLGEATVYRALGGWVLAARARGGRVWAGGAADGAADVGGGLHPRARLYAGGTESVRGYGENQLGPRVLRVRPAELLAHGCTEASIADASCDPDAAPSRAFAPRPVGGTALAEGSVELRRSIGGSIGGVLFADGASLAARFPDVGHASASAVTPGLGLRYESTVGTLRLDAAWRPHRVERLPVVVETRAADGTARVSRLLAAKSWDPDEGARGLRGALRHVTLHFALGHAF